MQPVTLTIEVEGIAETLPQESKAVAVPKAPSMSVAEGLHPSVNPVPVAVITGPKLSTVHVIVLETAAAALPQASVAFQVRV